MRNPRRGALALLLGPGLLLACQGDPPATAPGPDDSDGSSSGGDESGSSDDGAPEIPAGCGNGIVEADEACDLGFANAQDGACTPECTVPRCGDGRLAPDEACDEGEDNGGPTCTAACTRPTRLRWSTALDGDVHGWDLAVSMAPVADGAVIVTRSMEHAEGSWQALVERYEADGSRPWSTPLDGPLRYYGGSTQLHPAADGGVLLSVFADEVDVEGSDRMELRRIDAAGQTRWRHVVTTTALGRPLTGHVTTAGSQVVLTVALEVDDDDYQTLVTRLDDDGAILHERTVDQILRYTAGTTDGGFFAHGSGRLMRVSPDDQVQWSVTTTPMGSVSLAIDDQERPIIARRDPSGARLLQAYDADGRLRWETPLGLAPRGLFVGPDGAVAVVGTVDADPMGLSTNVDLGVETFDATGGPRWLERVDGPAHSEDSAEGVAIATDGAVWAGGTVSVPFASRDAWIGRFEEDPR